MIVNHNISILRTVYLLSFKENILDDPSSFIESLTKALQSIPALMEALIQALQTPYGWIPLAGILLWFAVNKDLFMFFRFYEEKQKKKLDNLEKYFANDHITEPVTKEVVSDFRDSYYFKMATGIQAERKLRNALIDLHRTTSADITWVTLKRALPYFEFIDENKIEIKDISQTDKLGRFYNAFVGWLFISFSAATFIIMITFANKSLILSVIFMVLALTLLVLSLFSFSQNFPIKSALKIKSDLKSKNTVVNET